MTEGKTSRKFRFISMKAYFSLYSIKKVGLLVSSKHPLCPRASMGIKKTNVFKDSNIRDMSSTEIIRDGNYIYLTAIIFFHLELMSKTVSLNVLGLKLVKLESRII